MRRRGGPWDVVRLPEWTPLDQAFRGDAVHLVRGLYRCDGVYLLTRALDDEDHDVPPQVGAALWALDDEVAVCLYDTAPLPADVDSRPRPPGPPGVPLDVRTARRSAQLVTARYRFSDGAYAHSTLALPGATLHLAAVDPGDDDRAVGVTVRLRRPGR